jgi:hypothetical protein
LRLCQVVVVAAARPPCRPYLDPLRPRVLPAPRSTAPQACVVRVSKGCQQMEGLSALHRTHQALTLRCWELS